MLKAKLTAEEFELLTDEQKECYVLNDDDGSYSADVLKALELAEKHREHKERILQSKINRDGEINTLKTEKEELEEREREALKKKGDFKTLYDQEKLAREKAEGEVNTLNTSITEGTKETKLIAAIASASKELVDSPNVAVNLYLKSRLKAILDDKNVAHVVVLDENGQQTSKPVSDLVTEIREMKDFENIVKGRDSSGGGAGGNGGSSGADKWAPAFDPKGADLEMQAKFRKEFPAEFPKRHQAYLEARKELN